MSERKCDEEIFVCICVCIITVFKGGEGGRRRASCYNVTSFCY